MGFTWDTSGFGKTLKAKDLNDGFDALITQAILVILLLKKGFWVQVKFIVQNFMVLHPQE